jgi:hypothetical protein
MRALDSVVVFITKLISFVVIACEIVGSLVLNALKLTSLDGGVRRTLIGAAIIGIVGIFIADILF